jgi:hypothetical protein
MNNSVKPFVREDRYLVFKHSDLERYVGFRDMRTLDRIASDVKAQREEDKRSAFKCVVVESDWLEFEPVWDMLEKRFKKEGA